jgi:two-component system NtrC family sensor kinase
MSLAIIQEVVGLLGVDAGVDDLLARVAGVLERGLGARECRVWLRTADGSGFRWVGAPGAEAPSAEYEERIARWITRGEIPDEVGALRLPLIHQGEHLGLLECRMPEESARSATCLNTARIVAGILSPLLSSIELSEDLASEVALRTREIEAQRRFTAKIIDSLPVGLYVIDREYRIQAWNRKRETGTQGISRDDALGRTVFEVMHRQPRKLIQSEFDRVLDTGAIEEVEVASHASGESRHYRITKVPMRLDDGEVTHVITIGEDITHAKAIQQQVSQTEKLAAVGQLAAGVMHEINNPLATISACMEALELRVSDLPRNPVRSGIAEYLGIVASEVERCKSIVNGLLDFSRPKARTKRMVAPNQVVEDALYLVKYHDRFKRITVVRKLADNLPDIRANPEQLIQVFLDIMLNAIDAMDGDGTLTVGTQRNPERDDEILVTIHDTGMGIQREDVAKIFEPFFTTKAPGQGTGLGLSIAYSIVAHHQGRIQVDSQVGSGSAFRIYLPLHPPDLPGEAT